MGSMRKCISIPSVIVVAVMKMIVAAGVVVIAVNPTGD